jgi:hypothetical protein
MPALSSTPAPPRRLDRFLSADLPRALNIVIEPLPLYASELSALAEDDRIEYMPVAAGRQKMDLPLLVPKRPGGSSFLPKQQAGGHILQACSHGAGRAAGRSRHPGGTNSPEARRPGIRVRVHRRRRPSVGAGGCDRRRVLAPPLLARSAVDRRGDRARFRAGFRLYDAADEERWSSGTLAQVDVIFFVRTAPCSPLMVELKIRDNVRSTRPSRQLHVLT